VLTVETEGTRTQRVQMKGVLSCLARWPCPAGTGGFCSSLAALVSPVQKYFFPSLYTFSTLLSPSLSKLGSQPCWVACLLVCVSGRTLQTHILRKQKLASVLQVCTVHAIASSKVENIDYAKNIHALSRAQKVLHIVQKV
jgi:hypothetical protein